MSKVLRNGRYFNVYYRNNNGTLRACNAKITSMYLQKHECYYGSYDVRLWVYNDHLVIEEHSNPYYMHDCTGDNCVILREVSKYELEIICLKYLGYSRVCDLKYNLINAGFYYSEFNNDFEELVNDCLYYRGEDYSYEYISQDDYDEIFSYFENKEA